MVYKNLRVLFIIFLITIISCESEKASENEIFLCCGENPFEALNIDNLNQTQSEIIIPNVFTPNQDGVNDIFIIPGLASYPNHSVIIYDLNDTVVYETYKNNGFIVWFDGENKNTGAELEFGSYKYKIVIENEQTYLQVGYLCLVRNNSETNGFDFSNCTLPQTPISSDPVLSN